MKFAVVLFAVAFAVVYGMPQNGFNHMGVMSLAAETSGDSNSLDCLSYYYPILLQIETDANVTIATCKTDATNARAAALANVTTEKSSIDVITGTVSASLNSCKDETNVIAALQCYSVQGGVSAADATEIANDAQVDLRTYNQKIEVINATSTNCIAVATEQASEESTKVYSALNLCMNLGSTYNPLETTAITAEVPTTLGTEPAPVSTENPNQPPSGK